MGGGRVEDIIGHEYLVHYSLGFPEDFDEHTDQSIWAMVDRLIDRKPNVSKKEFEILEKSFGIKWDPDSLYFDLALRDVFLPKTSSYYDWMHCLVASSGLYQYVLNYVVVTLGSIGISLQMLDYWISNVKSSSKAAPLDKKFFEKRVADQPLGALRGFAVEMISAVFSLDLFFTLVVDAENRLPELSEIVHTMKGIMGVFLSGPRAVQSSDALLGSLRRQHRLLLCFPSATKHAP